MPLSVMSTSEFPDPMTKSRFVAKGILHYRYEEFSSDDLEM
jgi:hypothetical protein